LVTVEQSMNTSLEAARTLNRKLTPDRVLSGGKRVWSETDRPGRVVKPFSIKYGHDVPSARSFAPQRRLPSMRGEASGRA
jgi:hypothetical protein